MNTQNKKLRNREDEDEILKCAREEHIRLYLVKFDL
jgi:hypothetical protein